MINPNYSNSNYMLKMLTKLISCCGISQLVDRVAMAVFQINNFQTKHPATLKAIKLQGKLFSSVSSAEV